MVVLQFAQQPVLASFAGLALEPDQQPLATHPLALKAKVEMALVDVGGALARDRRPGPAVPQHHRPAAIFVLWDRPLELDIGHRMVLGPHRQPLDIGIGRWPLGHRPALEHPVDFEPQVPVEPGRVVFLDDEEIAARAGLGLARRLGRLPEIALGIVAGERIGARHRLRRSSSS